MKQLVLIIALAGLLLAGCASNGPSGPTNAQTFLGGTDALVFAFDVGSPPDQVMKTEAFAVLLQVENKGEHNLEEGQLRMELKGFNAADFGKSRDDLIQYNEDPIGGAKLDPVSGERIGEDNIFVTYENLAYQTSIAGPATLPFYVDFCYAYQTLASGKLCIKEKLQGSTNTDVCTLTGAKDVASSSGPVSVTSLEEYVAGADKIRFSFYVKNLGEGKVYDVDNLGTDWCEETYTVEDYVHVTVDTHLTNEPVCAKLQSSNEGRVRFTSEGQVQISCIQDLTDEELTDQVKLVDITIDYLYSDHIEKQVTVIPEA
ncbi:MAG: hypothetical protein H6502_04215 [Candidatus Woesearchaeota archaeon]|nr:MAG: hypothetical protein H6502_04215 [Candidatus Woesearchaeota archaeon]